MRITILLIILWLLCGCGNDIVETLERNIAKQKSSYEIKSKEADVEILEFCQYFRSIHPPGSLMPEWVQGFTPGSVNPEGMALEVLVEYKKWKALNLDNEYTGSR